jgi:hypothetical protein
MLVLKKEENMREYWLNVMGDDLVAHLETEWFSNDADSELLEIVRADLIDDYIANNLDEPSRLQFEKHFLPNNLDDVLLAKASINLSISQFEEQKNIFETFIEKIRSFTTFKQVGFALLFLACFGLFIVYIVNFYNRDSQQIAHLNEPTIQLPGNLSTPEELEKTIQPSKNKTNSVSVKETENTVPEPQNIKSKPEISSNLPVTAPKTPIANKVVVEHKKPILSQVLLLTTLRGNSKILNLSSSAQNVLLKLEMPGIDRLYKSYEVRIYDSTGKLILKQPIAGNLSDKKSGDKINLSSIKTTNFKKNTTYKTSLFGIDEKNEEKELCVYDSFKVN